VEEVNDLLLVFAKSPWPGPKNRHNINFDKFF